MTKSKSTGGEKKRFTHSGDVAWCECPCHYTDDPIMKCERGCWTTIIKNAFKVSTGGEWKQTLFDLWGDEVYLPDFRKALKLVESLLATQAQEIREESRRVVIHQVKTWTKGRNVTKEALRQYLNTIKK